MVPPGWGCPKLNQPAEETENAMATIKPFRGLRFSAGAGDIRQLTCPPYDIISEEQRLRFLQTNPNNIIRLELPKGEDPYKEAGETLRKWTQSGILKKDEAPAFYIYEEEFTVGGETKRLKGFISWVQLEEWEKGVVLPHEETLSKAKEDRLNLMKATGCNFSQIYSLYMDEQQQAAEVLKIASSDPAETEFTDEEGITHRMWRLRDPAMIELLENVFADKKLYIADGHHRYETAINYRNTLREQGINTSDDHPSNYVMMMLVDMQNDGLVVLPTHRIVRDLENFDSDKLCAQAERYFDISEYDTLEGAQNILYQFYRAGGKAFILYADDCYRILSLKDVAMMDEVFPGHSQAYRGLDVAVIHSLFLEKLLGIDKENMAQQINLTYTRSADEAIRAVDNGDANCALLLNPTKIEEIRDVAAAGEKMPQKSTYFYPKLITGLVMNKIL